MRKEDSVQESEVVNHLSKEITTHIEQMMNFRTRVAYTLWIGPFVLLGGYLFAIKDIKAPRWDRWEVILIIAASLAFVGMSYVLAGVEAHTWDQCNRWRDLIVRIQAGLKEPLKSEDLHFKHNLFLSYGGCCILLLLIFLAVLLAVFRGSPASSKGERPFFVSGCAAANQRQPHLGEPPRREFVVQLEEARCEWRRRYPCVTRPCKENGVRSDEA